MHFITKEKVPDGPSVFNMILWTPYWDALNLLPKTPKSNTYMMLVQVGVAWAGQLLSN